MRNYAVVGEYLAQETNGCTCYGGDAHYGHESGCGYEPVAKLTEIEAALYAVMQLRKLHYGLDTTDRYTSSSLTCQECRKPFPCPTSTALNRTDDPVHASHDREHEEL